MKLDVIAILLSMSIEYQSVYLHDNLGNLQFDGHNEPALTADGRARLNYGGERQRGQYAGLQHPYNEYAIPGSFSILGGHIQLHGPALFALIPSDAIHYVTGLNLHANTSNDSIKQNRSQGTHHN